MYKYDCQEILLSEKKNMQENVYTNIYAKKKQERKYVSVYVYMQRLCLERYTRN